MGHLLDIIICTYDREELLADCLKSLSSQSIDSSKWMVNVVNNAPKEFSKETNLTINRFNNIQVVKEVEAGLSVARNAGISNSQARWIAFLDDDARVPNDYVLKILEIIKMDAYDCFGGHIISWWNYGKPRWLSETFGSKPTLTDSRSIITEEFNWGSNIVIRRSALSDVGGFPTYIGMKGSKLGYAAENIVQMKLREKGYVIGYDPNLYIEHVVMAQKLKIFWHLKSAFATGRDGRSVFKDQYGLSGFFVAIKNCISRPLKAIFFMFSRKNYYWENALLEGLKPYFLLAGKLRSLI